MKSSEEVLTNGKRIVGIIVAGVVTLLVFYLTLTGSLWRLDNSMTDSLYLKEVYDDLEIYVVAIDEDTLDALGSYTDWSRQYYADLINRLCDQPEPPKVIAFDILFTGYKDAAGDAAFVEACKRHGNVIVGSTIEFQNGIDGNEIVSNVKGIHDPYDELKAVAHTAFVNKADGRSRDGYVRHLMTTQNCNGRIESSLALKMLEQYTGKSTKDFNLDEDYYRFSYYAGDNSMVHAKSMIKVINGELPLEETSGKIVLVGGFAEGFGDDVMSPVNKSSKMYGVGVHANIANAIYTSNIQKDANRVPVAVIYGLLAGIIVYILFRVSLPIGAAVSAGTIIIQTLTCLILFKKGLYMRYVYLPLTILIVYIGMVVYHYLSVRMEKLKIKNAFKLYVSPQVVDEVAKSGNYELKLGGETKDIAVLFIDIRGFTTMSEGLEPGTVVGILNEYFAVITDAIFKNGGTLDKFIGDAAMAVFNSPFDLENYEYRAVRSALDIAACTKELQEKLMAQFGKTVNFGIGVNAGPATIGNIGCEFRMDFTAIGDTVNTASRLESNAKAGQILISSEVFDRVGERFVTEDVGELKLKGKTVGIHTYNVLSER